MVVPQTWAPAICRDKAALPGLRIVLDLFAQSSTQAVSELLCLKSGGKSIIRESIQIEVEDLILQ